MKTKIILTALLCAFNINAVTAEEKVKGKLDVSYASDYYFRGASLGQDSIQVNAGASTSINQLDVFADVFTNQTTGDGTGNTDIITIGAGGSLTNLLNVYGGLINVDVDGTGSELDAFVSFNLETVLDPSLTIYRNTDDDLYTVEGSVSHTIVTDPVDIKVTASAGTTDVTSSDTRTYVGGTVKISKTVNQLTPHLCLSVIDVENQDAEFITKAGLTFKF